MKERDEKKGANLLKKKKRIKLRSDKVRKNDHQHYQDGEQALTYIRGDANSPLLQSRRREGGPGKREILCEQRWGKLAAKFIVRKNRRGRGRKGQQQFSGIARGVTGRSRSSSSSSLPGRRRAAKSHLVPAI